jgi:hypothetical protein
MVTKAGSINNSSSSHWACGDVGSTMDIVSGRDPSLDSIVDKAGSSNNNSSSYWARVDVGSTMDMAYCCTPNIHQLWVCSK